MDFGQGRFGRASAPSAGKACHYLDPAEAGRLAARAETAQAFDQAFAQRSDLVHAGGIEVRAHVGFHSRLPRSRGGDACRNGIVERAAVPQRLEHGPVRLCAHDQRVRGESPSHQPRRVQFRCMTNHAAGEIGLVAVAPFADHLAVHIVDQYRQLTVYRHESDHRIRAETAFGRQTKRQSGGCHRQPGFGNRRFEGRLLARNLAAESTQRIGIDVVRHQQRCA